jgi:biopolymer transport protein ExbB/TolQ
VGPFVGLLGAVLGIQKNFEAIGTRTPAEAVREGLWATLLVILIFHVIAVWQY